MAGPAFLGSPQVPSSSQPPAPLLPPRVPHSLPPTSACPQPLSACLQSCRTGAGQNGAEAQRGCASGLPSQSTGLRTARKAALIRQALQPFLPGCSRLRAVDWKGRQEALETAVIPPPAPSPWLGRRAWNKQQALGEGVTIQSTCHPHSQAASSSLLTNEGGGVGEADTEGGGRRGQTRRCEKRGREAKRKAQCGAEAAGSDRPEGQRARGQRARLEPRLREAGRQQKQAQQRPGAGLGAWAQGDGPPGLPSQYLQSSQETGQGRAGPTQGKGRARQAGPRGLDWAQTPLGWGIWAPEGGQAPHGGQR